MHLLYIIFTDKNNHFICNWDLLLEFQRMPGPWENLLIPVGITHTTQFRYSLSTSRLKAESLMRHYLQPILGAAKHHHHYNWSFVCSVPWSRDKLWGKSNQGKDRKRKNLKGDSNWFTSILKTILFLTTRRVSIILCISWILPWLEKWHLWSIWEKTLVFLCS